MPWYIHDAFFVLATLSAAFFDPVTPLEPFTLDDTVEDGAREDVLMHRYILEQKHLQKVLGIKNARIEVVGSLLRVWFAAFLAWQLESDHFAYNWGFIFLPLWIYIAARLYYARHLSQFANELAEINVESISAENIEAKQAEHAIKQNLSESVSSMSSTACMSQCGPIFLALLLISRLEVSSFSTFLVIFPIFLLLFCCCFAICCSLFMVGCVDPEGLEKELRAQQRGEGGGGDDDGAEGGSSSGGEHSYVPPATFAPPSATDDLSREASTGGDRPTNPLLAEGGNSSSSGSSSATTAKKTGSEGNLDLLSSSSQSRQGLHNESADDSSSGVVAVTSTSSASDSFVVKEEPAEGDAGGTNDDFGMTINDID